jgi:hypothetical protein
MRFEIKHFFKGDGLLLSGRKAFSQLRKITIPAGRFIVIALVVTASIAWTRMIHSRGQDVFLQNGVIYRRQYAEF